MTVLPLVKWDVYKAGDLLGIGWKTVVRRIAEYDLAIPPGVSIPKAPR
jgi:hypothetical protein